MENLLNYRDDNERRFKRRPYVKTIDFILNVIEVNGSKNMNLKGETIDISDGGICVKTDYPLEPGHTLLFSDGIGRAGVVKWCARVDNTYKVGVQLKANKDYVKHLGESKDGLLSVSEEREKYTKLLYEATDKFNKKLENLEKRCFNPEKNPDELLNAVTKALTDMIYVCEEFEKGVDYDKSVIKDARIRFREKTNPVFSKSYCINRTRTWPQGYQGDYKTLEGVYRNTPLSDGIGYYLDRYMLSSTLAEGVRQRLIKLGELLRDELITRQNPKVLDIACGSCREILDLIPEIQKSEAKFTCVDLDSDALNFSMNRLSYANLPQDQIELFRYNALRMFDHELNMMEFGMQDIIYSVGYFDYLPDDFLIKMLNALYMLLNPGGKLIASFKDADRYRAQGYHWFADWDGFLQRNKEDFDRLFAQAGIPANALSVAREKSGVIIFYTATK